MSQTLDNLTYTWNNAGTTFTALKFNVTDTASNASSLLMDLQVGGSSRFSVSKSGVVNAVGSGGQGFRTNLSAGIGFEARWGASFVIANIASTSGEGNMTVSADGSFRFSSSSLSVSSPDLFIRRDAANTLAQRNSTNAQTFRTYGTFTDGSNYRRVALSMSTAGVAELKPEGAGTGASGNVLHISGLPTSNPGPGILWNNAGTPAIGT